MAPLAVDDYLPLVRSALAEDIGSGDATSEALITEGTTAEGWIVAREALVVAGLPVAETVFREVVLDPTLELFVRDGQRVEPGATLLRVAGAARGLLSAERTALNFVQRLSGIATLTARFVQAIQGTQARLLDTRKTTPGWRRLEKYAVRCGGGQNHREGLFDMVLVKDNHLAVLQGATPNPVAEAVRRARHRFPHLRVEVEADTLEQVRQAVAAGADMILLDNMSCDQLRAAVQSVAGRCPTEASGGVRLDTIRAIAETGVSYISVGALTHSAPAVDIGLDFILSGPARGRPSA